MENMTNAKKKIVFICESLGGGVRRHILDILLNIDLSNYQIYVIYGTKRADAVFLDNLNLLRGKGITFYPLTDFERELSITKDLKSFIKILSILNKIKPDIVHCHSSKAGAVGRIASKFLGIKKILYTPHAYYFQDPNMSIIKKNFFICIEKLLGLITNNIVHVSKGEEKIALKNNIIPLRKSVVIYNGIEEPHYKNQSKCSERNKIFIIGTVGRMDYQKNPFLFVDIAKKVCQKSQNIYFKMVGEGPNFAQIKKEIVENNLENRIELLGFQSNINEIVASFDVFLSSSRYEGLPYSLIEALALKKTIIATNVIGNNEIVETNKNGYLFEENKPENAVKAILQLFDDNENLQFFSNESYKLFQEKFSLKTMLSRLEHLYIL